MTQNIHTSDRPADEIRSLSDDELGQRVAQVRAEARQDTLAEAVKTLDDRAVELCGGGFETNWRESRIAGLELAATLLYRLILS